MIVFWKAEIMTISNIYLKLNIVLNFNFYYRVNAKSDVSKNKMEIDDRLVTLFFLIMVTVFHFVYQQHTSIGGRSLQYIYHSLLYWVLKQIQRYPSKL